MKRCASCLQNLGLVRLQMFEKKPVQKTVQKFGLSLGCPDLQGFLAEGVSIMSQKPVEA